MLHINDITLRLGPRVLFDKASAALPDNARIGFVGRNGAGKTTLFHMIAGEHRPESARSPAAPDAPWPRRTGGAGRRAEPDRLRARRRSSNAAALTREAEHAHDPARIADIQMRLVDIDAHAAPARAAGILAGLGFDEAAQNRPLSEFSGGWRMRVALAAVLFSSPRPAAARRADQLSRSRRHAVADRLSAALSGDHPRHQP